MPFPVPSLHSISTEKWIPDVPSGRPNPSRKGAEFFDRELWPRIKNLFWIPAAAITHSIDTIGAVCTGTASVVLGDNYPRLNQQAKNFFDSTDKMLPDLFAGTLRTINPRAAVPNNWEGTLTLKAKEWFRKCEREYAHDSNAGIRHVAARIGFVCAAIAFIAARVVDTVIGIFYAIGAIFRGGKHTPWNQKAYEHLNLTALPGDLYRCAYKAVRPWAALPM